MSIDHYILTKIHICIFVLVMFSTVNGTPGSILSSKTYNPNNIVTIISEGTVTRCINSPG